MSRSIYKSVHRPYASWMNQPNHTGIYIAVMIVLLVLLNLFGVRSVSSLIVDVTLFSLYPPDGLEIVS